MKMSQWGAKVRKNRSDSEKHRVSKQSGESHEAEIDLVLFFFPYFTHP